MPDGDIFDQHGRMWWKTSTRKLFMNDETFEFSAAWSVRKVLRDGNLTALTDLADAVVECLRLNAHGIDSRVVVDVKLREIERQHLDLDSQTAIRITRDMLTNATLTAEVQRMADECQPIRVAQELLARLALENCYMPGVVHALQNEKGIPLDRIRGAKERGIRLLRRSEALADIARQQLQQGTAIVVRQDPAPRPRTRVDQESLVHSAFGA